MLTFSKESREAVELLKVIGFFTLRDIKQLMKIEVSYMITGRKEHSPMRKEDIRDYIDYPFSRLYLIIPNHPPSKIVYKCHDCK